MTKFYHCCLIALLCIGLTPVRAHHGQDFLLLQDYQVPSVWSGSAYSGFEWSHFGGTDESGVETGAMIGIAPRLAFGANIEFSDAAGAWGYASVMPYLHLQLTPSQSKSPIRVALQAGYQFAQKQEPERVRVKVITPGRPIKKQATATQAITITDPGDTGGGGGEIEFCGPEYGPDAPPCPTARHAVNRQPVRPTRTESRGRHSSHEAPSHPATGTATSGATSGGNQGSTEVGPSTTSFLYVTPETAQATGIHRHGENFFAARLILEADLTESDKLLVNFINVTPESGKPAWGYAAGLRHSFTHEWAAGVEAIGDLGTANEHELVLGGYYSPTHHLTFKLGVGVGLTPETADVSVRTGVVWRF